MAENNSSAPLKTAEGAYPALPEPVDHIAEADGFNVIGSVDVYTAEQMRAYAAQAVAAQAAPAAVAVPDEREELAKRLDSERDYLEAIKLPPHNPTLAIEDILNEYEGDDREEVWESIKAYAEGQARGAVLIERKSLAATPALPVTEDSSAGDLAAVEDLAALVARLAHSLRQAAPDHDLPQEAMDYLARHAIAPSTLLTARPSQAEVRAEPVAEARVSQDAAGKKTVELELRYGDLPTGTHFLFTAPQAQPADALDAALIGDCLPMQPVIVSPDTGVYRFKENRIVTKLLSHSELTGYSLNEIARDFNQGMYSADEQMQLAQLIGYSVDGYGTLSYVTDESYQRAAAMAAAQEGGNAAKDGAA